MWRSLAFSLILAALSSSAALAQEKIELSPFGGVRLAGSFRGDIPLTTFDVKSAPTFGTFVNYDIAGNLQAEFLWSHEGSQLVARQANLEDPGNPSEADLFDMGVDYFHGGLLYGGGNETYDPYVAFGFGVTKFSPDEPEDVTIETSLTKFSFSIGGGFKGYIGDRIGFRFDARAFGTRAGSAGEDFACGVFGCVTFTTSSTFWQSHLVGAIMIRF